MWPLCWAVEVESVEDAEPEVLGVVDGVGCDLGRVDASGGRGLCANGPRLRGSSRLGTSQGVGSVRRHDCVARAKGEAMSRGEGVTPSGATKAPVTASSRYYAVWPSNLPVLGIFFSCCGVILAVSGPPGTPRGPRFLRASSSSVGRSSSLMVGLI